MLKKHAALIVVILAASPMRGMQVKLGPDAVVGKKVYDDKCEICHGADGQGKTGYAAAMGLEPAPLTSAEVQKKTDPELKKIIREGSGGKMKPIRGLSDADIANVIAYVRTAFRKK
jgi:cytochrome c